MKGLRATIMIPAYNVENFIGSTLDSARNQRGFDNYEIVVVNDGSTDNTVDIVREYAARDKRIRLFTKANGGNASARNVLLDHSRGDILFGLDADDLLDPNALSKVVACYEDFPSVNYIYTDQAEIDEGGQRVAVRRRANVDRFSGELSYNCHFQGHLKSFRREAVGDNRFDENLKSAVDWDFFLKLLPSLNVMHLPCVLYSYRMNTKGVSFTRREEVRDNSIVLLKKYLAKHAVYGDAEVDVQKVELMESLTYYDHFINGESTMRPEARETLEKYLLDGE